MESVTLYLDRARQCAKIAESMTGEDKKKLMAIAEAWLQLADEAAKEGQRTGIVAAISED